MPYWHELLPPGAQMDVQYEDLVADLEGVSRAGLAHCRLDWEDACSDFHDTKGMVRTASLIQVREPLCKSTQSAVGAGIRNILARCSKHLISRRWVEVAADRRNGASTDLHNIISFAQIRQEAMGVRAFLREHRLI